MDEGQCINKMEVVNAQDELIGKDDASARGYVHQDVQDGLDLASCQARHVILPPLFNHHCILHGVKATM
jgi:hypothetical protein